MCSLLPCLLAPQIKQRGSDSGVVSTRRGKLIFVDLAGSERVRKTTSTYDTPSAPPHAAHLAVHILPCSRTCFASCPMHPSQWCSPVGGKVHQHIPGRAWERDCCPLGSSLQACALPRLQADASAAGLAGGQSQHVLDHHHWPCRGQRVRDPVLLAVRLALHACGLPPGGE